MARTNTGASANYFEYSGTPPVTAVPITMMCWFMVPDVTNYYALMAVLKFANAGTDDYFSLGAAGTRRATRCSQKSRKGAVTSGRVPARATPRIPGTMRAGCSRPTH